MLQNRDYLENEILKIAGWSLAWWFLLFFLIYKTYKKSALFVQKPVTYKIGIVRNIVFIVIGTIASIHFVKVFFAGIKALHTWNELMADNFVKSIYGLAETAIPVLKYMKAFFVTVIVGRVLSFLVLAGITLLEVLGISQNYRNLHAPIEVNNSSND